MATVRMARAHQRQRQSSARILSGHRSPPGRLELVLLVFVKFTRNDVDNKTRSSAHELSAHTIIPLGADKRKQTFRFKRLFSVHQIQKQKSWSSAALVFVCVW